MHLLIYVDDIIIAGNNSQFLQDLLDRLSLQFSINDLGVLNYFLGIEVSPQSNGIHLTQTRYLQTILDKAHMTGASSCASPMQSGLQLSKFDGAPISDPLLYRSIVGMLQYATITRPDLTFAVNKVSQFFSQPSDIHWQAVKHILRFIAGTLSLGLHFTKATDLHLQAFCDADWAGCPDDRRSTTGFAIFLGSNLGSWSSKKQSTVSRSSTEAEYRAMAVATAELMWLQTLLTELGITCTHLPSLWCDNLSATFLAANPVFHARTKHIELDFHFVREQLQSKRIKVHFVCSADQMANALTKSLPKTRFLLLRDKLTVCSKTAELEGV
jgi:Reverse transcriptase (RNA-dependent DNA polymerase)